MSVVKAWSKSVSVLAFRHMDLQGERPCRCLQLLRGGLGPFRVRRAGRRGEARDLAQPAGFGGVERPVPGPAQHTVRRQADHVLLHRAQPSQPAEPGLARGTAGEPERLDHRPGLRPPQPSAAGDDRMRHREHQGAAGQRQALGQQPAAELGQEHPADGEFARSISQVISADLRRSGLFAPIDPAAYIERIVNTDAVPRFADWRVINAQALVTGRLTRHADGRLKSEFRLWDVFAGQQLIGQQYFTTPDNWRFHGQLEFRPGRE
jgi:hypothetical protein